MFFRNINCDQRNMGYMNNDIKKILGDSDPLEQKDFCGPNQKS